MDDLENKPKRFGNRSNSNWFGNQDRKPSSGFFGSRPRGSFGQGGSSFGGRSSGGFNRRPGGFGGNRGGGFNRGGGPRRDFRPSFAPTHVKDVNYDANDNKLTITCQNGDMYSISNLKFEKVQQKLYNPNDNLADVINIHSSISINDATDKVWEYIRANNLISEAGVDLDDKLKKLFDSQEKSVQKNKIFDCVKANLKEVKE